MSVPKSHVLSCSRGILAQADVKLNSPSPNQNQNVNVNVVYPDANPYIAHYEPVTPLADDNNALPSNEDSVTNAESKDNIKIQSDVIRSRSVETATATLEELQQINSDREQLIIALTQLLDIYEHNPLIVNKYVIADDMVLSKLIKSLTAADSVTIYKEDYEPSCFGKKYEFSVINKIIVVIKNEVYNLKYNFPDVVEFLENHHVSIKFCN